MFVIRFHFFFTGIPNYIYSGYTNIRKSDSKNSPPDKQLLIELAKHKLRSPIIINMLAVSNSIFFQMKCKMHLFILETIFPLKHRIPKIPVVLFLCRDFLFKTVAPTQPYKKKKNEKINHSRKL